MLDNAEEANAFLAAIVESCGDAIIGRNLEGQITYWNEAAERLFGFRAEEILGRSIFALIPAEFVHAESELPERIRQGESIAGFETVRVGKDGIRLDVALTLSPIRDGIGKILGVSEIVRDNRGRKAAEGELHRRNQELNAFLETAQIGLHRVGPDGTVLWANAAEMEMLGYKPEEYIGHHIAEFHADETAINEVLGTLGRGNRLYEYEARLRCKDGSVKHVLIDSSVLWEDGRFVHTQCFTRDISRRKAAETELREAKLRSEQILERITDGFIAVDREWRLTYINRYAAEIFGRMCPAGELLWKNLWEAFPGLIGTDAEKEYRRAMAEQVTTNLEMYYAPLRGWFEVAAYASEEGLSIFFKEITARKELEQSLHESQQLLRGIVDHSPAVIYVKDFEGRYLLANRRYLEIFHVSAEWIAGKTDYDLFSKEKADLFRAVDQRAAQSDHALIEEEIVPQDDGQHTYLSVKGALRDQEGKSYAVFGISTDITERKRAEEALQKAHLELKEQAEELQEIADAVPGLIAFADRNLRYRFCNRTFSDWIGKPRGEIVGHEMQEGVPPHIWAKIKPRVEEALEGKTVSFELERGESEVVRWAQVIYTPRYSEEGRNLGIITFASDITGLKEAEAALRESERVFRAFVTASSDIVYRMNGDWTEMRRLEGKDFISDTVDPSRGWLLRYIPPDDQEEVLAAIDQAIREKEIFELEHRVIRVDGTPGWTFSRAIPLLDERGEIIEWFGAARDITDRKRAEEKLRESEERFRTLADNIAQFAWMADAQGSIFWYNRRWFEYTGTTLEEMKGWGWTKVHHPEHVERVVRGIQRSWETGEPWQDTFPLRRKDGVYRWFLSRALPIHDENGKVLRWFGTNTDITEERETAMELLRTRNELQRLNNNLEEEAERRAVRLQETVGELETFSYSIVHDMRAPLRALQGFAQILLEDYGAVIDENGKVCLQKIGQSADRMDRMVRDVLNFSNTLRGELPLEKVDVRAVLRGVLEGYPQYAKDRVDVVIEGELPPVQANPAALGQCVSNILANAVKFVAPGAKPRVKIWAVKKEGVARLNFEDNGIGIPTEQMEKVFNLFYQLDKSRGGTGVGLAVVRKAVQRMGGRVGVQPGTEGGSCFWIELKGAEI